MISIRNENDFKKLLEARPSDLFDIAKSITHIRFGNTIKFYVPLYLSNYCSNNCPYCSFAFHNKIERTALTFEECCKEADKLISNGHRHILLVAGSDRKNISVGYLKKVASYIRPKIANLMIEVEPLSFDEYKILYRSGIDGVTLYQETYNKEIYEVLHTKGSKTNYDARLASIENAAKAGMRFIGIGALLGLSNWKDEAIAIYNHVNYLSKKYWQTQFSISFPRIQPNASDFKASHPISDDELAHMIAAMRIARPDDDLILSTREKPELRTKLIPIGITRISAGSKTTPGAYSLNKVNGDQFEVADRRSASDVANELKLMGYDVVWKDWI